MQADWNDRAREDANYYVAFGRRDQQVTRSGSNDSLRQFLKPVAGYPRISVQAFPDLQHWFADVTYIPTATLSHSLYLEAARARQSWR
jgi:hypothetical protein